VGFVGSSEPLGERVRDENTLRAFVDRNAPVLLSGILVLALGLRLAALLSLKTTPFFDFLLLDEAYYHSWALKIASGTFSSHSVYEFSPLPAYLTALIYRIFSPDPLIIRFLNIGLGVHTCYLVYRIGRDLSDRAAGLISCLVAALYMPFILYSVVPLKTSLAVFLFALTLSLFLSSRRETRPGRVLFLGAAAGLLLNVRPNALLLVPLIPLLLGVHMRRDPRSLKAPSGAVLLYALGVLLAVSPFVARNLAVAGKAAITTSQAGFNLYQGNAPGNDTPYYALVPFAANVPEEQGIHFTIEAGRRTGTSLSPQEASSFWARETIRRAAAEPCPFLKGLFLKVLALVNRYEPGDHYRLDVLGRFAGFFRLPLLPFWLILPFGMAGMLAGAKGDPRTRDLFLIFLAYGATLVVFYTNTRYRLPLLLILIPLAVQGVRGGLTALRQRAPGRAAVYGGLCAAFFVLEFLPLPGAHDLSAPYNNVAAILSSRGDRSGALRYWREITRMDRPDKGLLALARDAYIRRDLQGAAAYLDRIPEGSFAGAFKYELRGDILRDQGKTAGAAAAYRRSLEINWGRIPPRERLLALYRETDPQKAAQMERELRAVASHYRDGGMDASPRGP
jgi:4-amino-4-deoxy-L-arabinose transferase-like glycosyltransferase